MAERFSHVNPGSTAELSASIALSEQAQALVGPNPDPAAFMTALREQGLQQDAVRFLAAALPKRRAVWWACLVAGTAIDQAAPEPAASTLAAAQAWVYKPTDENRRAAQNKAQEMNYGHPAAMAAMAAFFADGSMGPPDVAEVKAPDHAAAGAVAGAVMMVVAQQPRIAAELYDAFLDQGIDIANGGDGRPRRPNDAPT